MKHRWGNIICNIRAIRSCRKSLKRKCNRLSYVRNSFPAVDGLNKNYKTSSWQRRSNYICSAPVIELLSHDLQGILFFSCKIARRIVVEKLVFNGCVVISAVLHWYGIGSRESVLRWWSWSERECAVFGWEVYSELDGSDTWHDVERIVNGESYFNRRVRSRQPREIIPDLESNQGILEGHCSDDISVVEDSSSVIKGVRISRCIVG